MVDDRQAAGLLGGEVIGAGKILCPGPGHGPHDRSLCVWLGDKTRVHSFAGDDWRDCLDYVNDTIGHVKQPPRFVQPHETERNLHRARHLWSCRAPAAGTPVENYIAFRGCKFLPESIGYLEPGSYPRPAMIAAFGDIKEPRGVHLTFLQEDGVGKADVERDKIMLGPACSFPIEIAPINDGLGLSITEGIEDAISAYEATGRGSWAAGSASRMAALATRVPGYVESVTIFAHPDKAGEKGAYSLADALAMLNVEVLIEGLG
jgi:hypothetical protein